jgi:hypothetical protein
VDRHCTLNQPRTTLEGVTDPFKQPRDLYENSAMKMR